MTDAHAFMLFGVIVALGGFFLAATARAGQGRTVFRIFGAEISLAAAGGIVVMLMGILTFALPTFLAHGGNPTVKSPSDDLSGFPPAGRTTATPGPNDTPTPQPIAQATAESPPAAGRPSGDGAKAAAVTDIRLVMNYVPLPTGVTQQQCADALAKGAARHDISWQPLGGDTPGGGYWLADAGLEILCLPGHAAVAAAGLDPKRAYARTVEAVSFIQEVTSSIAR